MDFKVELVVTTESGAVYRFGPAEEDGTRTVSRRPLKLPFKKGQIKGSGTTDFAGRGSIEHTEPVIGEQLVIKIIGWDSLAEQLWFTEPVVQITQGTA